MGQYCPNGYGYNDKTKGCSWASDVCSAEAVVTNGCESRGQIFADPTSLNCTRFLYCKLKAGTTEFELTPVECPAGQIFNPTGFRTFSPTAGAFGPPPKPCSTSDRYFCPLAAKVPNCKEIADKIFIPDPSNCNGYYYCENKMRLKNECDGSQFHFDIYTKTCIYKSDSSCKEPITSSSISVAAICKGKARMFIPDNDVCTAYYYCLNENLPYQQFCPTGTYFSNGSCVTTKPSTCSCEDVKNDPNVINVPHRDSNKYWECKYDGVTRERALRTCFKGTHYDASSDSCVP